MLQERKTNIFYDGDEFRQYCDDMIEDRPINKEEDKILKIIRKYSSGNPYARITYNQVKPSDWKAFSENIVSKIIKEYLGQDEVDYARLRWFFRRLAQVGHSGGLQVVVDNINRLEPCLPSICSYISSIQEVPAEKWEGIGEQLVSLLEPVYNLFRISTAKARTTICRLVLSFLSQFFQRRRHFSSQPKDRSTTHRFGSTTKVCSSLRFTTSTEAPSRLCTAVAKGFPVYPPSTSTFCTWLRLARRRSNIAKAPARSVTLAVVT